ncbi:hypothetical protein JI747_005445 [Chryseobacterium sp. RG1]|uniref:Lipocalin-like domain-containing protein n=1 Tax=Chryseobacterium tagetis TaxID=2801334 RepID=A0ABS7ZY12_9FLAO|nr:hypothetical protein [Chryseobacterium tagetis]MCA6066613.1 hypothetical protein [Chryseobacterium tagetis]
MKKNRSKKILFILSLFSLFVLFSSCSGGDDDTATNTNNYKITVTLVGVGNEDFVSIVAVSQTLGGKFDVWKVNNVVKTGESSVSLDKADFIGGTTTYVIETTEPVAYGIANDIQVINSGAGANISVSYKIEKDNTVVINENTSVANGSDFTKNYKF